MRILGILGILLVLPLASCRTAPTAVEVTADDRFEGDWTPPPAADAEVVATVNGAAIYAADVSRQARALGQTAEEALHTLVDAELLAQEARRRGLTDAPDVVEARKRMRVRRFAEKEFLPTFKGPDDVPAELAERAYALPEAKSFYDHAEWRTVAWARVPVPESLPDADERARALARGFADLARAAKAHGTEQLAALAKLWAPMATGEFETALAGPAVPEFARAAFELGAVGDIGEPVRTKWGWDVVLLLSVNPERHVARAEALHDIRERLFDDARRAAFQHWADAFVARAKVWRNPDAQVLDRVSVAEETY